MTSFQKRQALLMTLCVGISAGCNNSDGSSPIEDTDPHIEIAAGWGQMYDGYSNLAALSRPLGPGGLPTNGGVRIVLATGVSRQDLDRKDQIKASFPSILSSLVSLWRGKERISLKFKGENGSYYAITPVLKEALHELRVAREYVHPADGVKLRVEVDERLQLFRFLPHSLPRVLTVGYDAGYGLTVIFSEPILPRKTVASLSLTRTASGAAITASATGELDKPTQRLIIPDAQLKVTAGENIKLSIGPDVGAPTGKLLDGKYTGEAGSGAFTLEFAPSTLEAQPYDGRTKY